MSRIRTEAEIKERVKELDAMFDRAVRKICREEIAASLAAGQKKRGKIGVFLARVFGVRRHD